LVSYAKIHYRSDDGADSRSFSTGTMKGTLKMLAGSVKTKLPEHMLQSKDKNPAALESEMAEKILFTAEPLKAALHKFVTSEKDTKASLEAFVCKQAPPGESLFRFTHRSLASDYVVHG